MYSVSRILFLFALRGRCPVGPIPLRIAIQRGLAFTFRLSSLSRWNLWVPRLDYLVEKCDTITSRPLSDIAWPGKVNMEPVST
jgi:hypothetical protein